MNSRSSVNVLARWMHRPVTVLGAVLLALALGASGSPVVATLRPLGDIYIALLQMCVLPFLLATIPLAVRTAMRGGMNSKLIASLTVWILCAIVAVAVIGVVVPIIAFDLMPFDHGTIAAMGALVGGKAGHVDLTFALDSNGAAVAAPPISGLVSVVPSNIFAALSADDTIRVLVFGAIFGVAMAVSERRAGHSLFGALQSLHDACLLVFQWLNTLAPIGIVALIAPQVEVLGPDVYVVLARFCYVFFGLSAVLLAIAIAVLAFALRLGTSRVFACFSKPLMVAAATRNTLACIPAAVETMTLELGASQETCELYIPVGFATLRFGTILHFTVATVFIGALLGHSFGPGEIVTTAALSVAASFATLGINGAAAIVPLAGVLRPFGLPYELAFPLLVIIDPLVIMVRIMLNVAVNCLIPALAARTESLSELQVVTAE